MVFAVILVAHWVGDFIFQTSSMALEKSTSIKWLTAHVATYTLVLGIFSMFLFSWKVALTYAFLNGGLHLITDFFTSKLASKYQHRPRVFYPILGFDQLIHGLCLYLSFFYLDTFI